MPVQRPLTTFEHARDHFNATAMCAYGQRPQLNYEPGCAYIECAKLEACKCRLNDGDGIATSAFLIAWRERFAK